MIDTDLHLITAAFTDADAAAALYKELAAAEKKHEMGIEDAALIHRDDDGRIHTKETGETSGGRGALIGGVIGGLIGVLGGPVGVVALGATGAWIGGIGAATTDSGIPNLTLEEIGLLVQPGMSAIVVVTNSESVDAVQQHLSEAGGNILTKSGADLASAETEAESPAQDTPAEDPQPEN